MKDITKTASLNLTFEWTTIISKWACQLCNALTVLLREDKLSFCTTDEMIRKNKALENLNLKIKKLESKIPNSNN